MRAVVQRVHSAKVEVNGQIVGSINQGLVAFVGAARNDTVKDAQLAADKISGLRVFEDDSGRMSKSLAEVGGSLLAISQFTVFGDVRRGRRPSFDGAMEPIQAQILFDRFVELARATGIPVETGQFRAMMRVLVDNDGPVTILIDSQKLF